MGLLTRQDLHEALVDALGSNNVYYEPPESVKLNYPCIVYYLSRMHNRGANNRPTYIRYDSYTVTYIDPKVEQTRRFGESVPERLLALGGSVYDRQFTADNLHHYVFTIYLG